MRLEGVVMNVTNFGAFVDVGVNQDGLVNISQSLATDKKWWTQEITVSGSKVTVKVDDKIVLEYHQPAGAQPGKDFSRTLTEGTFALQGHDPGSTVHFKNIRVKRLE